MGKRSINIIHFLENDFTAFTVRHRNRTGSIKR